MGRMRKQNLGLADAVFLGDEVYSSFPEGF